VLGAAVPLGLLLRPPAPTIHPIPIQWPEPPPPVTAADFFNRGRAYLREGNLAEAKTDFLKSYSLSKDHRAMAFVAYSQAALKQHTQSVAAAKLAIKDGDDSAEVYNNLGYALVQSGLPKDAIDPLGKALGRRTRMQAALHNRAMAWQLMGLATNAGAMNLLAADDIAVDMSRIWTSAVAGVMNLLAVDDIDAALAAGPTSSDLHFDAAQIFAACAEQKPALRAAAIDQVKAAIRAGKDPVRCREDAILNARLGRDRVFQDACNTPRGVPPDKIPQLRLVEPSY
jgi:tetratricopeptide (TPR) repeat protein